VPSRSSARRLHADRGGTTLRWLADDRASVRAYEIIETKSDPGFCVSTRSSELTFVLEGELEISVGPARRSVVARAGEGLLVLRGTPHVSRVARGTRFVIVDLPAVPSADLGVVALGQAAIPRAVERRLPQLWDQSATAPVHELEAPVFELVSRAIPGGVVPIDGAHATARMLAVKQHLEASYAGPVDLDGVARRFGLDRFYLVRAYTKNFGLSPMAYVQSLRLEHFVWSLMAAEDPAHANPGGLVALAGDAGYGDYSTFCRRIRGRFGRAPSELVARAS